jgi:histidine ammonia-lyase
LITVDGESLTIDDVIKVSRNYEKVKLSPRSANAMKRSRKAVLKIVKSDGVSYGINTGFGDLARVVIPEKDLLVLQKNLVRSHCAGVGDGLSADRVRASILLRANSLAKGYSGVRVRVVQTLLEMLNKGVHPLVPEIGSVGASGDLAPLAHIAAVAMGEGHCHFGGESMEGAAGMKAAGIEPLSLEHKEGVALINGTSVMTGISALVVHDSLQLVGAAQIAASMSFEALQSSTRPFDQRVGKVRPHKGQVKCARSMMRLLKGSEIIPSHKDCSKVQDAYTVRCIPQVIGPVIDTLAYARQTVETEINSATDNPLVFPETGDSVSCGNFHGQPIAMAMDHLSLAVCVLGAFAERRIARLVDSHLSGLPPFLTEKSGTHSGYMMAQCTAAALASENKTLAHPASADSIPTSAGQEDYVSMGLWATRKAASAVRNSRSIVAIELLCAAQGLEFHKPLKPGKGAHAGYRTVRRNVKPLKDDRPIASDIECLAGLIESGALKKAVEKSAGNLST